MAPFNIRVFLATGSEERVEGGNPEGSTENANTTARQPLPPPHTQRLPPGARAADVSTPAWRRDAAVAAETPRPCSRRPAPPFPPPSRCGAVQRSGREAPVTFSVAVPGGRLRHGAHQGIVSVAGGPFPPTLSLFAPSLVLPLPPPPLFPRARRCEEVRGRPGPALRVEVWVGGVPCEEGGAV